MVSSTRRGRSSRATAMRRPICASTVLAPTRSTQIVAALNRLMLPAITGSPAVLRTGRDSPVSSDSSTRAESLSSRPSTGTDCPGATSTRSPGSSSTTPTISGRPSRNRVATRGRCRANAPVRLSARCRPAIPGRQEGRNTADQKMSRTLEVSSVAIGCCDGGRPARPCRAGRDAGRASALETAHRHEATGVRPAG